MSQCPLHKTPEFRALILAAKRDGLDMSEIVNCFEEYDGRIYVATPKSTDPLYIYGGSDDLIELEGSVRDETSGGGNKGDTVILYAEDGTVVARCFVLYDKDGVWRMEWFGAYDSSQVSVLRGVDENEEPKRAPDGVADRQKAKCNCDYSDLAVCFLAFDYLEVVEGRVE